MTRDILCLEREKPQNLSGMGDVASQFHQELMRLESPHLRRRYEKLCQRYSNPDKTAVLASLVQIAKTQLAVGQFFEAVQTRKQIVQIGQRYLEPQGDNVWKDALAASLENAQPWQEAALKRAEEVLAQKLWGAPPPFSMTSLASLIEPDVLHVASQTPNKLLEVRDEYDL